MKNRLFSFVSLLTALVLMLSLALPTAAFADDGQPGDPTPEASEEAPAEETPTEEAPAEEEAATEESTPTAETEESAPVEEAAGEEAASSDEETEPVEEPVVSEETVADVIEILAETESVLVDDEGVPLSVADQETVELLTNADPWFEDPGDSTKVIAYQKSCTGWAPPAGYAGGVCNESTTPIQAAVDAAPVGATVHVEAGTFDEQVEISKNLTLQGSPGAIVKSPAVLIDSFMTSTTNKPVIYVHGADNVTISGLTVDGDNKGSANYRFIGIGYYNAGGTISNNTIMNVMDTTFSGNQAGNGIYVFNDDATARTVNIEGNTITNYQKSGIVANGAGLTANIIDNIVTGQGPTGVIAQNGIQIGFEATGVVANNTVTGNYYTGSSATSAGVLLYDTTGTVLVYENTLTGNQIGISLAGPDSGVPTPSNLNAWDNEISGGQYGVNIQSYYQGGNANGTITDNHIFDNEVGIYTDNPGSVITGNTISGGDYGVYTEDYWSVGGSFTINGNDFSDNDIQVTGDSTLNTSSVLAGNTFDRSVTVEHSGSLLPTIWSAIQDGVTAAVGGDIVHAGAGIYTENIQLDKSITLQGAGQGVTVIQPATSDPDAACAGSCLSSAATNTVIWVRANGVGIYDLTVDGDNPGLTSGVVVGGADIDAHNGIIQSSGGQTGLTVQNVTVQNLFARGIQINYDNSFSITNNTVNNVQGDYYSIGIFNYGGSGVIVGNTLTNVGDGIAANYSTGMSVTGNDVSGFSGSGIHTDNTGGADVISGNVIHGGVGGNAYGIFVFAPYQPVTVSGNDVSGVQYGLTVSGNGWMDAPNIIIFNGNTVQATIAGAYVTTDVWGYFSSNVDALFSNNVLTSAQYGFYLESQGTGETPYGSYVCTGDCVLTVTASGNVITTPLIADGVFYAIGTFPWYDPLTPDYNGIYNFNDGGNTWQADLDMDGVLDGADNCVAVANPGQTDNDHDGIGNACDPTPNGDDTEDEDGDKGGATGGTGPFIPVTGGTTTFLDPSVDLNAALEQFANDQFPLELVDGQFQFACVLESVTVLDAANYIILGEQIVTVVGQCSYLVDGVKQTITLALGEGFAPGNLVTVTIGEEYAAFAASGAPVDASNFLVPLSIVITETLG